MKMSKAEARTKLPPPYPRHSAKLVTKAGGGAIFRIGWEVMKDTAILKLFRFFIRHSGRCLTALMRTVYKHTGRTE
jgi:hypothetical protein